MRRVTSPRASRMGLPASMHSAIASSSKRSWNFRAQCISTSRRWYGGTFAIASRASCAAAMPASMAFASASATWVATAPVNLSVTSSASLAKTGSLAR